MTEEEYNFVKRKLKEHKGKIVRFPCRGEERLLLSKSRSPDLHPIVIEAALWKRQHRPGSRSEYKTYMRKSLESGRGRSVVNDGSYASDYMDAVEWIGFESEQFSDERLNWLDFPKVIVEIPEEVKDYE